MLTVEESVDLVERMLDGAIRAEMFWLHDGSFEARLTVDPEIAIEALRRHDLSRVGATIPSMEVIEKNFEDRALLDGVQGKRVAWVMPGGVVELTTLRVDVLEVPRCPLEDLDGQTIEEVAERLAREMSMDVGMLVHWPAGEFNGVALGESAGIVLVRAG